jgi:hypothetical protein
MKEAVKEILRVAELLDISLSDALFVTSLIYGTTAVPIDKERLIVLIDKGIVVGNQVDRDIIEALNEVKKPRKAVAIFMPILCSGSADITLKLIDAMCPNGVPEEDFLKYSSFTKNEALIPFLHVFFSLFPSNNPKRNVAWDAHFGIPWKGNTRRVVTGNVIKKLEKVFKSKDAGMVLYALYTHIKESYSENNGVGNYYMKNINNYLKESDSWYDMVGEQLKEGKLDHMLSGKSKSKSNMFIL